MNSIEKFTLHEFEGKYENRPLESLLYFCGQDTNLKVPGYFIEKQFELPNYFLLLINWDCPFEEGCEIVVLNKQLSLVGCHSFKPFYNTCLLTSFRELSKDRYELKFNNSNSFELSINYPKQKLLSKVVKVRKFEV